MNKKLVGISIFFISLFLLITVYFVIKSEDTIKIDVRAENTVHSKIIIKQKFLNDEIILYENDKITTERKEIVPFSNKGESELTLSIDGKEQSLVGYIDTNQSPLDIKLEVTSNLEVQSSVKTALGIENKKLVYSLEK